MRCILEWQQSKHQKGGLCVSPSFWIREHLSLYTHEDGVPNFFGSNVQTLVVEIEELSRAINSKLGLVSCQRQKLLVGGSNNILDSGSSSARTTRSSSTKFDLVCSVGQQTVSGEQPDFGLVWLCFGVWRVGQQAGK